MNWAGYMVHVGDIGNAYKIYLENLKKTESSYIHGDMDANGRC
jgi:hypothetical protein